MKKIVVFLFLIVGFALAQVIGPTTSETTVIDPDNPDITSIETKDRTDKGPKEASVEQKVHLYLPKATALHLDVPELLFDLTSLDTDDWPENGPVYDPNRPKTIYCAEGYEPKDRAVGPFPGEVYPLGTSYSIPVDDTPDGNWDPTIKVQAWDGTELDEVIAYPNLIINKKTGELEPGSKNYFICYRAFLLQKFSNFDHWVLRVDRAVEDANIQGIEHIYIQDNPCGGTTGPSHHLAPLKPGEGHVLLDSEESIFGGSIGTTGDAVINAGNDLCGYKSWLDDLVVVAIKINSDKHGSSEANLTYTLTSFDWDKPTCEGDCPKDDDPKLVATN